MPEYCERTVVLVLESASLESRLLLYKPVCSAAELDHGIEMSTNNAWSHQDWACSEDGFCVFAVIAGNHLVKAFSASQWGSPQSVHQVIMSTLTLDNIEREGNSALGHESVGAVSSFHLTKYSTATIIRLLSVFSHSQFWRYCALSQAERKRNHQKEKKNRTSAFQATRYARVQRYTKRIATMKTPGPPVDTEQKSFASSTDRMKITMP